MSNYYLAFDNQWFLKHQKLLLWFLNGFLKHPARYILHITEDDIALDKDIYCIGPNRFYYDEKDKQITVDIRTHDKFSKRLYYAFKPLWWILHFWDWLIADRFIPEWSYGFDSLTALPQAGSGGGNTTCDALVNRDSVNESFSTIQAGAGTTVSNTNTSGASVLLASSTSNQYAQLTRTILTFDTSSITSAATILSAIFRVRGNFKLNDLGSPDLHLAGATPASNTAIVAADFTQCGTTSFGSVSYASFSTSADNDFTLNSSGLSNISKTGISRFSTRLSWDINNSFTGAWVGNGDSEMDYDSADASTDPRLIVTYSLPFGTKFLLMGVGK